MVEWTPEQKQFSIDKSLLKRRATPDDIADVVLFLGFSAHMVTGQIIIADAGRGL
jgi:3-oxoacyl-[acyl-carrier protein] reductase